MTDGGTAGYKTPILILVQYKMCSKNQQHSEVLEAGIRFFWCQVSDPVCFILLSESSWLKSTFFANFRLFLSGRTNQQLLQTRWQIKASVVQTDKREAAADRRRCQPCCGLVTRGMSVQICTSSAVTTERPFNNNIQRPPDRKSVV